MCVASRIARTAFTPPVGSWVNPPMPSRGKTGRTRNEQPVFLPRETLRLVEEAKPKIERLVSMRVTQKGAVNFLVKLGLEYLERGRPPSSTIPSPTIFK